MKIYRFLIVTFYLVLLTACTPDISPDRYDAEKLGRAQQVEYGQIVKTNVVEVASRNDGTGSLLGAAAGATAGSVIGGSTQVNILGALGGAAIGGITGHAIGKRTGNQKGIQYIVHLDNGKTVSIIQGNDPQLHAGQRVMVLTGDKMDRVIAA